MNARHPATCTTSYFCTRLSATHTTSYVKTRRLAACTDKYVKTRCPAARTAFVTGIKQPRLGWRLGSEVTNQASKTCLKAGASVPAPSQAHRAPCPIGKQNVKADNQRRNVGGAAEDT